MCDRPLLSPPTSLSVSVPLFLYAYRAERLKKIEGRAADQKAAAIRAGIEAREAQKMEMTQIEEAKRATIKVLNPLIIYDNYLLYPLILCHI
jgi:hypothetical protein